MFNYVEFNVRKDLVKESNFTVQKGIAAKFEITEQGFRIRYEMPQIGFVIPVEVKLGEDFVETKILADGLVDEKIYSKEKDATAKTNDPKARLVSIRLFPFLGAQTSDKEDGFLFVPDGSGAVIDFKKHRAGTMNQYSERVYGDDFAFSNRNTSSNRNPIRFPVLGIKSNKQGILGVITEGEEYANIVAAASGTFSQFNWVAPEQLYRFKFFQPTDTKKNNGYLTYSNDITITDRSVRYYLIEQSDSELTYVSLAERYRNYLMQEFALKPLEGDRAKLKLQLHLLGGDIEEGFLWNSYLPLTTTKEAEDIVQEMTILGVGDMHITYLGWQNGGYSKFGGDFPIASKIGGDKGMQHFVDFVHSKGYTINLDASSYGFNNTGKDGFRAKRDGLRDLGSSVIGVLVSPKFSEKIIEDDLQEAKSLGIDGYSFGKAIGSFLNSDFNNKYLTTREQSKRIQNEIFAKTKATLGSVQAANGNAYTLKYAQHLDEMPSAYSFDLFVDHVVPFAQIAIHGLATYSFEYANLSDDYVDGMLKGIEYGATPSFMVTYADSQELLKSVNLGSFYSTNYKDWKQEIVTQYQKYKAALGDVQDKFITGHRQLADNVFETTYSNGKQVIVNYNNKPVAVGNQKIEAKNYAVSQGGM
ncbi:unnamed protein product [Aphanomyces euteiches]